MLEQTVEFKSQVVRDLAWAISSPPLMSQLSGFVYWPQQLWFDQIFEDSLPWLNALDEDPAELEALLDKQKDRRLGKYFESLWFYLFSHHSRFQIIENNLQIIIEGETLGELDLIVFDKLTKKIIHWELAVKFYLGVYDTCELKHWHGPNLKDHLSAKLNNLQNKQSVISRQARVASWLKKQGILIDESAVILKGRLYFPQKAERGAEKQHKAPAVCAPNYLRGAWCTQSSFDVMFDEKQRFLPLINSGWMEKIPTGSVKKVYSKSDIFKTLSNNLLRLPLHVQVCNPCHSWDRLFIVDDNWPQKNI